MTGSRYPPTYGSAPPGGNIQAPPYFTPTPSIPSLPRTKSETYTQQVSYRPNPKSTTTTTKFQKKSLFTSQF